MKHRLFALAALLAFGAGSATAEDDAASLAERGEMLLGQAALALSEAATSDAEIRALTATLRGYETGLEALRAALRQAAREDRAVRARLAPRQEALTELIVFLQTQTRLAETLPQAHPEGALAAIRAGFIAADMTPALSDEVSALLADLAEIEALTILRENARDQLRAGALEARTARLALITAVTERRPPPDPFSTDAAAMQALINSSETLAAFADSLAGEPGDAAPAGDWPLPVAGTRLRAYGERDAAGVARDGWIIAARPEALVTAPAEATVRFAGPMPGQGGVVIMEPTPGEMLILTGLGRLLVQRDDILGAGDPVALMPGNDTSHDQILIETAVSAGQPPTETLYIEIRRRDAPLDPVTRFDWRREEG